jgi:hypothetical protein
MLPVRSRFASTLRRLGPFLALTPAACVTVTPAQRQLLSKPEMTPASDSAEEVWHSHVEAAREAGFGGHGAAGGGCGCG